MSKLQGAHLLLQVGSKVLNNELGARCFGSGARSSVLWLSPGFLTLSAA